MAVFFWISFAIVFYTFIGYGVILWILVEIKKMLSRRTKQPLDTDSLPTCSVVIAAFNEEAFIREKILNTLSLRYPDGHLEVFVVADGSTDDTATIVRDFPQIKLLFEPQRLGKVNAINRAMNYIQTDVIVFTDANTYLNRDALMLIGRHFNNPTVGGVAGEKRIFGDFSGDINSAGESLYWRYESTLKKLDSRLNTTVGAAGELFSIRRNLYESVPDSIVLDDFIISMGIACKGFKIVYEPNAFAIETASSSIKEELKRKIRIAAGGIQSIVLLRDILKFWKFPLLSFQYISHRVLRWSITPFLLIAVLISSGLLTNSDPSGIYTYLFILQIIFYSLAFIGFYMERVGVKLKVTFIPYYFSLMNFAIIAGIIRYYKGKQSSVWEKTDRKRITESSVLVNP